MQLVDVVLLFLFNVQRSLCACLHARLARYKIEWVVNYLHHRISSNQGGLSRGLSCAYLLHPLQSECMLLKCLSLHGSWTFSPFLLLLLLRCHQHDYGVRSHRIIMWQLTFKCKHMPCISKWVKLWLRSDVGASSGNVFLGFKLAAFFHMEMMCGGHCF